MLRMIVGVSFLFNHNHTGFLSIFSLYIHRQQQLCKVTCIIFSICISMD